MRLTVGPLSPAVYWRRRAVVLGVGLLFLIVVLWSCTGPGKSGSNAAKPTPTPTTPAGAQPTESVLTPQSGAPAPEGADDQPADADPAAADPQQPAGDPAAPPAGTVPDVPPPAAGSCTDDEISVVPVPVVKSIKQNGTLGLRLEVTNTSDRTCSRDLGADLQELFIKRGAEKVWSSDTCGTKGSSVVSLVPDLKHTFQADWNINRDTKCGGSVATGPKAEPGEYQIFARLGTKHSDPVALTITS
ncbi:hypothetical protein OG792_31780 [Micromonospora sp. NBC_01699]|uniref:hypothetical protein n=1 Tax=Micromonospora sp. NBC_01699 TaxID=2975984 RepID=UPI002E2A9801|nr:hypothetical protein [Micromonospora sp. NBC_01699]